MIKKNVLLLLILGNCIIAEAQSLKSITPNYAIIGDSLTVTISGSNTSFTPASPTVVTDVYLSQVSGSYLNSLSFKTINDSVVTAKFNIPIAVSLGYYDVHVNTRNQGNLILTGGFLILLSGIDEIENSRFIEIYPNPATDNIQLQSKLSDVNNAELKIYDVHGKEVFSKSYTNLLKQSVKINISDFSQGIYFLSIKAKNKTITKKFVIER